jgi:hypothetical protein
MASDYALIRTDNEREYGAGIGRWGPDLLTNRYDDRTHFIFELLQNAEDALARRKGWQGWRAVNFSLSATELRVTHCGKPFDGPDVRGICGIGDSTKDLTAIGRFGIGFKSVYAFTHQPEVHSGAEDFAIENFVWPIAISPINRHADETVFVLPLPSEDAGAHSEIAEGLRRLGARTLLFLRHIEEIAWSVEGGPSGLYVRGKPEQIGESARRIVLLGEEDGKPDVEETWLLFTRDAKTLDGTVVGRIEIAFSLIQDRKLDRWSVQVVNDSHLVVFFPTVVETHLGFLVQGPYRTTPSRDNVPRNDPWNQHLAQETATLLVEALRALRAMGLLDVDALRTLPLDPSKFEEGRMFAPLFVAVREALKTETLLPASGVGHVSAGTAKLARTQELRELFDPAQLAKLYGATGDMFWLSGDITEDRTPELQKYVMRELGIAEVTPVAILPKLTQALLEQQSDGWMRQLYEFLHGQPALLRLGRFKDVPLVRLEDGKHVTPAKDGRPQAFLPAPIATDFPTVRGAVCGTDVARAFLVGLGLTPPDPVDDVIWNVLPKHRGARAPATREDYEADIRRILAAFATDSKVQRDKLVVALRGSAFVRAIKPSDGTKWFSPPGNVYLATERLKDLFAGVSNVLLIDDSFSCLRGEPVRDLLVACGAARYLQPVRFEPTFTPQERAEMRRLGGCESSSGAETIEDSSIRGLDKLLATLAELDPESRAARAAVLWEALGDLEGQGAGAFAGSYRWTYFHARSYAFDAAFVRQLNETAWVPDASGNLQRPEFVVFDGLGWKPNPFLLSKIRFKPPIIDQLAKEAGLEPGVLDLLKRLGVTSVADLHRLGIKEQPGTPGQPAPDDVDDALKKLLGGAPEPTPPVDDPSGSDPQGSGTGDGGSGTGGGPGGSGGKGTGGSGDGKGGGRTQGSGDGGTKKRTPGGSGGRPFISYVATGPDDEDPDPDGLDQTARMALEAQAITLILEREPKWQRTPTHNPGFDLLEPGAAGTTARWCEVKAMTGSLRDRPVGLSHTQFDCAREHGQAYWLYVVERAGAKDARIVRIQDPAGKARTFTFDHGWLDIAALDTEQENPEE